jgi:hypothetical protein
MTYYLTATKGAQRRDYLLKTFPASLMLYEFIKDSYSDWEVSTAGLEEADVETQRRLNRWEPAPYDVCKQDFIRFVEGKIGPAFLTEPPTSPEVEREALAEKVFLAIIQNGGWHIDMIGSQAFRFADIFLAERDAERAE